MVDISPRLATVSYLAKLLTHNDATLSQSTPNNVFPKSEYVHVSEKCLPNAPRGSI